MIKKFIYSKKIAPYVFIVPFILTFLIFWIVPIIKSGMMSFQSIQFTEVEWIGLDNYKRLLGDSQFRLAVFNSVRYMIGTLILLIPIPMIFACFINSKVMKGKEFFKSVFFIPALTSVVVAGTIFRLIFGEMGSSLMNQFIGIFGLEPIKWLKNDWTAFFALLTLACWRWTGVNMLYFLSGLQSIPKELYESAQVDGANAWQKFIKISVPMLKPTIIYVLTISIYAGLSMFVESYMLWEGKNSPKNIGLTIVGYLYNQGIRKNNMGYASAVGLILLIIVMVINVAQLTVTGLFKKEEK